jgi:hypothetical protein
MPYAKAKRERKAARKEGREGGIEGERKEVRPRGHHKLPNCQSSVLDGTLSSFVSLSICSH